MSVYRCSHYDLNSLYVLHGATLRKRDVRTRKRQDGALVCLEPGMFQHGSHDV